jgi:carbon storage regulator
MRKYHSPLIPAECYDAIGPRRRSPRLAGHAATLFSGQLDKVRRSVHNNTSIQMNTYKEVDNMLVLSRKESERIRLGESIVVTVVRVSGDKVRLGIEAPSDVLVLREELEPHAAQVEVAIAGT